MENANNIEHSVIIEKRSKISFSGILDVLSFDEQTVVLKTEMGDLTIKGESLKVNNFAVETGTLSLEGKFSALAYTSVNKKNLKSRLFG